MSAREHPTWQLPLDKAEIHPWMPWAMNHDAKWLCLLFGVSIWDREMIYNAVKESEARRIREVV